MELVAKGQRISKDYLGRLAETVNAKENPITYLGIDPGKANGVCGYDAKFYLSFMLTINADDMVMFLNVFKNVKKCITESFSLYPNKARDQIYSDMETSRVIGRIESWAVHNNVELIMQPATIKKTGYLWIGEKPLSKSNPRNHEMDGHVHFMYWAVKNGHISAEELLKKRN